MDDFPSSPSHGTLKQPSVQNLAPNPTAFWKPQILPDIASKAYPTSKTPKWKVKPWYKIFHSNLCPTCLRKYLEYHLTTKIQRPLKHLTQMVKIYIHHAHSKLDIPQEDTYKYDEVNKTQEWGESSVRGGNKGAFPK